MSAPRRAGIAGLTFASFMFAGSAFAGLLVAGVTLPGGATDDPDARAAGLVARLTPEEKLLLVATHYGTAVRGALPPPGARNAAGFAPGVPRLGIPPLRETDAGFGVANPANEPFAATAMPSGLAVAATFDPSLAEAVGSAVGEEARALGFSVLLGGGANLVREPRGGRAFEYAGEDPLLTGVMVGAAIRGAQDRGVVATLKHFALNAQENGRVLLDARLGEAPARESDLLAFEIALERGRPGAVMTGYNRVNGVPASQSAFLISEVLKGDWGYRGWVMSDWGGTHATAAAALAGLDQESGLENDSEPFFGRPLAAAVAAGAVPAGRLDDMVRRILRSRIAAGQFDARPADNPDKRLASADLAAHAAVAQRAAEAAIVLLKNEGALLPLRPATGSLFRVLLVGGHADAGVLSGGGSSQVVPARFLRTPGDPPGLFYGEPKLYDGSAPLAALRRELPDAHVDFIDGRDPAAAAAAARAADVAIVFAEQWSNESRDSSDLALPDNQDALIAAVAAATARTVVVLQTGHAVTMPWLDRVPAVLEAWYPGERGGEAIAGVLSGRVDPSGHLPISFPAREADLPRPLLPRREATTSNPDEPTVGGPFAVNYDIEGSDVGYKWHLRQGRPPLFPFGRGLTYTRFAATGLSASAAEGTLTVAFDLADTGDRPGVVTAQVYLDAGAFTRRLVGWHRAALRPGEARHVVLTLDPRLIATFDPAAQGWRINDGDYVVAIRADAAAAAPEVRVHLHGRSWPARHGEGGTGGAAASPP